MKGYEKTSVCFNAASYSSGRKSQTLCYAGERGMRQFIAIRPCAGFLNALTELRSRLCAAGVRGAFQKADNLHLTLAFIGEWPEAVTELLPVIAEPFPLTLTHIGVFEKAKVLWAGVEPSEALNALARKTRQNLIDAGVPCDPKGFNPHITLLRKPVLPSGTELARIELPRATMLASEVCLYSSERGGDGMIYTVIGRTEAKR